MKQRVQSEWRALITKETFDMVTINPRHPSSKTDLTGNTWPSMKADHLRRETIQREESYRGIMREMNFQQLDTL